VVLYETLGPTLPDGAAAAAVLWGAAQLCAATYPESVRAAGFRGEGAVLGNALFEAVLREKRGLVFTVDEPDINWEWIRRARPSGRLDLAIPELLGELAGLEVDGDEFADPEFPLILSAGERRSNTAQTLIRDPAWRKRDPHGALRISPTDAHLLGLHPGAVVDVVTRRGRCTTPIEITDMMAAGNISLPNGLGLANGAGGPVTGVPPNELTSSDRRDWLAGTPWHKHVPARIERVADDGTEPNPDPDERPQT
jgi:anaerobic selenocysteine-containing dehydrogenase